LYSGPAESSWGRELGRAVEGNGWKLGRGVGRKCGMNWREVFFA
jgi:hypothetical protein